MVEPDATTNVRIDDVTRAATQADERTTLLGFLQKERDIVAWKLRGLDDAALRSVSTASGLTAHGVVRHLENVERSWIRHTFADEPGLSFDWTDEDPDAELRVPTDVTMASLLAAYAEESARCDAVVAASALDAVAVHRARSLRWIVVHLIEETARHLGHLDLLVEQATGAVGELPGG
jgi:hypothetical protein